MSRGVHPWEVPASWTTLTSIDAHTAGEPLRIFTSGFPDPPGETMLDKRRYAETHLDDLRRATMWEPRGHADMYGCVVTEPVTAGADFGVLFLHNAGFSTMCGHGVIAVATVAVEAGWVDPTGDETAITMDTPAGRVDATVHRSDGRTRTVTFRNVPSFVLATDVVVVPEGVGPVRCDIAYGGAFYAYVDAAPLGLDLVPGEARALIDLGSRITRAVADGRRIPHPSGDADLGFLYGTIFVGDAHDPGAHSRNVCVFADGEVDRSPTGTGVSGRLAIHSLRDDLPADPIIVESILGTTFTGSVVGQTTLGGEGVPGQPAIIPEIGGSAHIVGQNVLVVDPDDPLGGGFLIR